MSQHRFQAWIATPLAACLLLATTSSMAAETPAVSSGDKSSEPRTSTSQKIDVEKLRKQIAEQQKQIDAMQKMLAAQQRVLDAASEQPAEVAVQPRPVRAPLGEVASTSPMIPAGPAPMDQPAPVKSTEKASPLQFGIGNTTIMPVGFMDITAVWRDKDAGSSIGSNFGSIPFNNATAAHLGEFRFSPQNSRLGFRVDGDWKGAHFIGYNEFDFLGTSGSNNLGVTNGAFVPRLRLFWVDVRKDKWEMLAGQSWSMMTPNRKGISALPGDLFYSQVIDVNYMIGLPWTRQPGARILYHPSNKVTFGLSLENPDQYIGGSGGGPAVTLPAALTSLAGGQFDNASNVLVTPNVHPDIIAKLAFDPSSRVHFEIAGIERTFKDWNPVTGVHSTKAGAGGSVNANFEVVKNFHLITNNYWSDGGGRYLFGNAPDVVIRADGSISPVHSGGTVDGFEAQVTKNTLFYAYYGGIYIGRNVAIDANGTSLVGYGYRGSANSQNRAVQEATFGFNQTIWKDAKYGAINFMGQYEYLSRNPWYVAVGAPKNAHDNTIYFNLRYTLPGSAPTMGK
jgi:uncharacterized coiled-coil protein SlyX